MLLVAVFVLILFALIARYLLWSRQFPKGIPPVSSIPFVGGLLTLSTFRPDNLHVKFGEFVQRYGRSFRAEVFGVDVVVTADLRITSALLSSSRHLHKHKLYMLLSSWLGNGLLLSHGTTWHTMRKILTPTFHFQILEDFLVIFDQQSRCFVEKLRPLAGDGTQAVNIGPLVSLLTLDTIAETAMGVTIKAQEESESEVVVAVKDITNILFGRLMRPHLAFPLVLSILAPQLKRKQQSAIEYLHKFTRSIIEQRHAALLQDKSAPRRHQALLDVLLQASVDGQPLTHQQIEDEVNTFMFEGHDTTSSAASFCLYLLSRHPRVQRKLYQEICEQLSPHIEDRTLQHSDLLKLPYLNCVVRESLRLYPPIPAIGRWLHSDLECEGVGVLPAGTNVILLLWELLRDPGIYSEPETFNPERFESLGPESGAQLAYTSIPFSAGPRNCIGQRFALNEIKTIVIRTLQTYELVEAGEPVQPLIRFVLTSKSGINMALKLRE